MRISSVTHTLRERVYIESQTPIARSLAASRNWLARGFVCGAYIFLLLGISPAWAQSRKVSTTTGITAPAKFEDTFDGGSTTLSTNWAAHPAYKIKVKTVGAQKQGQVYNSSSGDYFDGFLAMPKASVITNPNIVKIVFGDNSDALGRAFSGIAMLMNKADTTGNGYLIFHNANGDVNRVRLYKIIGGKVAASDEIESVDAALPAPEVGKDTLGVEFTTDESGHHFIVTINGVEDAVLTDPDKFRSITPSSTYFGGIMINGNTNNGIDYFSSARTVDNVAPRAVTDLAVTTVSASAITIKWKAPGDDGGQGTADKYDIRYSTSPINDGNFSSATPVANAPKPAAANATQTVTVGNLSSSTTYYFALTATDLAGNTSELSNVVSSATTTVSVVTDDFNRTGPALGAQWKADPSIKIVENTAQNTATTGDFRLAIFDAVKNPTEASLKWGPKSTPLGHQFSGLIVMATGTGGGTTSNGYFIQYNQPDSTMVLWHVVNGKIALDEGAIDEGQSFVKRPPAASVMKVEITSDATGHTFTIYINDQLARILKDPDKREGNSGTLFAGFMLDRDLGAENAIDSFSASTPVGRPKKLEVFDGNNQIGSIDSPLANPLAVLVSDSLGNPVPNVPITFEPSAASEAKISSPPILDGNIRLEAEQGNFNAPMEVRNDPNASGGKYIVYPLGIPGDAADTITVDITQAGTYYMWVRSLQNSDRDRWEVFVDDSPIPILYDVFKGNSVPGWNWELLADRGAGSVEEPEINPVTFNWTPGKHKIVFHVLFEELGLDKIILTTNPAFVPSGREETGFLSDKNGVARAVVVLGPKSGTFTAQAKYNTLTPATFSFSATGGKATKIEKTSGDAQTGSAGQQLPQPFVVTVRDARNNLVGGYAVDWVVTDGNGKLSAYRSTTDLNGKAQTFLTLGNQSPTNKVEARVALTGTLPSFTATTISGLVKSASIVGGGNGQTATVRTALPNPVLVKVSDASGGAVANYPVEFVVTRGGGSSNASNRVANPGFETFINGTTNPASWTLDGAPSAAEVQVSTTGPKSGTRSLSVNSIRTGVGVSQNINYLANTGYTLSFYAKVTSGAARLTWQMSPDQVIDLTQASTKGNWQFFTLYVNSPAAGTRSLSFKTVVSGTFFIDEVKILPNTGGNGQAAIVWTMGDTAAVTQQGQAVVLDGANANLTGSPLKVSASAKAGAVAKLIKSSGDNQAGAANQPLLVPFTVKAADVTGINGVAAVNVKFEVIAGGGKLPGNVTTFTAPTNALGLAQAVLTLGAQSGATNRVRVSATGVAKADTFTAVAAIPARMTKGPSTPPTTGSAGRRMAAPIVARVFDANGKIIAGFPVTFTVKEGGGTINGGATAIIPTDLNGDAKAFPVLGPVPGSRNRFEAAVLHNNQNVINSPQSYTVRAVGLKTISLVSGDNQSGGVVSSPLPQPLKVKIADSLNAGIKDQNVIFTVTLGGGTVNNASATTAKTDTAGVASVTWILGPTPGTSNNKVQATANQVLVGAPITFQASAVAGVPKNLKKVSRDSISSVVSSTLPLTVKVTDLGGNAKSGVNVTFTIKSGGGKINGVATTIVTTQNNGQATATLTLGSTAGAFNNVVEAKATFNNADLTGSPLTFRITGTSSKAFKLALPLNQRQTGKAGEVLAKPIRVKVEDKDRNGVANHPVVFRIIRGDGTFTGKKTEVIASTDASGYAQANWYLGPATKPDSQIVHATSTDGVNNLQGVPMKFVASADPGPPSSETSFVQATPATLPADGTTRSQITIFVRDRFGNAIKSVPVTVDVTGDGVRVNQPATPTDQSGIAEGSITATRAESKTVTAKVISSPPITITRGATVRVTPLNAQSLIQGDGNGQIGNINTALLRPLGVKVGDRNGNGVPNFEVKFKVERGNGKLADPLTSQLFDSLRVRTNEEGVAQVRYICGSSTGENHIRVSAAGLLNSPLLYLASVQNFPAAKVEMIDGSNGQAGTVGDFLRNPVGLRVLDNGDRPVSAVPVRFGISLGGGVVNEQTNATVNTDVFGEAKVSWRLGPEAGLNVLRADASGLANSPIDFEAQANPDRATALRSLTDNNTVSGKVNGLSETIIVQTTDPLGNGVQSIAVIFEIIEGAGSLTDSYVLSGENGYAPVRVRFGTKSGWVKVRASAEGLANSPMVFMAYAEPQSAVRMTAVARTNNQTGTKGKLVNFPLQAQLFDNLNNPVAGVQVQFVVTGGSGNFSGNGFFNAITDSLGIASAPWTLGGQAGPNTAKANKTGLVGSPVVFTATAVDNNLPIILDVPDVQAIENEVISFNVSAGDLDGDAVSYEARNLPSGASFDAFTRRFTWQTDLNSAGRHEPSFIARDSKGGLDEEIVVLNIANRNRSPFVNKTVPTLRAGAVADTVIRNPGNGGTFTMRIFATDPDGDLLSYRWYRDGVFTGGIENTYDFTYSAVSQTMFSSVSLLILDKQDTLRITWMIKVPVELSSFSAAMVEGQRVLLNWKTASEQNNIGFNVLRSRTESGKYEQINAELIPPRLDGDYEFADATVDAGSKYFYKLQSLDRDGQMQLHGPIQITIALPQQYVLEQNYPNPFNPSTHIRFELPKAAIVTLSIYNSLGQEVRRLVSAQKPAGYHTIVWNGKDQQGRPAPSGIYHYRLQAGDFIATKKMLLAK